MSGTYGLGGYQTLAAANNYEPTAGGTAYYPSGIPSPVIQSGQAFLYVLRDWPAMWHLRNPVKKAAAGLFTAERAAAGDLISVSPCNTQTVPWPMGMPWF